MSTSTHLVRHAATSAFALMLAANSVQAQVCLGTPSHSNVAYERGTVSVGGTNGGTLTLVGGRAALSLGARAFESRPENSTLGGDLGFALQFNASRLSICPNIGIGYLRNIWEPVTAPFQPVTITSHNAIGRGGLAVGFEQPVYRDFAIIPHVGARYAFRLWYLTSDVDVDEGSVSGDTTSSVELEYGLSARYRNVYLGWSAVRDTDNKGNRPASSRLFVGLAWGLGRDERSSKK